MDALKAALKRALKDAQEMPLEAQIREREGFIERARKRIAKFDEERAAELLRLEESERKLARCSATSATSHRPCRRSRPFATDGVRVATAVTSRSSSSTNRVSSCSEEG